MDDPSTQKRRFIDTRLGIILVSSELPELLGICDRIYTLAFGRMTGVLPIEQASPESLMELMTQEREQEQVQ